MSKKIEYGQNIFEVADGISIELKANKMALFF